MEFGEKIKALRLERGMTLEQVGNLVGVGKSTVRKWESGQIANMRRDKIALLAQALGVSPAYLMGWSEDPIDYDNYDLTEVSTEIVKHFNGDTRRIHAFLQARDEDARREAAESALQAREDLATDPDRKALLNLARYGSAQDVRQVAALIDALRATNPDFYDGDDPA